MPESQPPVHLVDLASLTRSLGLRRLALALVLVLGCAAAALGCGRNSAKDREAAPIREPVASRTVFADELLWAFGPEVRARVVALSTLADDARYSTVAGQWPETVPRLGPNPEQLLALAPSLVILASFNAPEYRAAIEDKLEVLVLADFDGFDGYLANVAEVGRAIGEPERAAALQAEFRARRLELEAQRPPEAQRPTVVSWGYGNVAGARTTFDDAARTAGFVNLAAREGIEGYQRLDVEQLVAWAPEYLVIGCGEASCEDARASFVAQPGINKLPAIRAGHVIAIEAPYLSTTGAAMLELSARMQAQLLEQLGR